ncbi:uncharacterized protein LOC106164295 [Lingula anatina]|uniref:Uncharacterized protein LOC106164295 n=1 Tax=Lingula anatina TaxID=7574 RepID=A0A1S3IHD8_LINAN|nr:uncharacterized protein LOC106164295 [Lingula anatina]XP_013397626.1 uncharacterized protein LOC106164295 [Lingula anatina]XP_013397627.1 uncharacterized protein LOC106164295 [Lingula anatina]XP_013397628.1 uncharacterized protein LOC106164295 [Lingula anatina]XP_013397629.1 uncharacterized protein LOC106164295 [Lingula anatina]XP_013397630.1 uncharacterized protein LOC106164295 [Lingula anatina]XP_013397632.1 uncharacterized protein LOC106164295 [Lingula anatina]|eukprot:XP_013397625.1 uncharacterized protein LOC106164295 [Lingula anatina]
MPPYLPMPGQVARNPSLLEGLRVLLVSNAVNSLTNRVKMTLQRMKVITHVVPCDSGSGMENAVTLYQPDVIICPYLTKYIPETIWKTTERPCLVFHPGIAGDRGPNSIDWAIRQDKKEWGATLLQASPVMDGGDIWSTATFPLKANATKTGVYGGEISDLAAELVVDGLTRYQLGVTPTPLDYNRSEIKGCLLPSMKKSDREIDWSASAEDICRIIRSSDTQPGALADITFLDNKTELTETYRVYGAHIEQDRGGVLGQMLSAHKPGSVVGKKQGSILVKSGDNRGVWITCLKDKKKLSVKLPAVSAVSPTLASGIADLSNLSSYSQVWLSHSEQVCYVHFDFYNGAMDCNQADHLKEVLSQVAKMSHIRVVVLMGGERFFSTGIHLCHIEASSDPVLEAWHNINKIDDVILEMSKMTDKLVVAALQGNAGAGGAMLAAAADVVVSHPGVLLTPSYQNMSLYGSEYWTYFFPKRVGKEKADEIMYSHPEPILAEHAQDLGIVDNVIGKNKMDFYEKLPNFIDDLARDKATGEMITAKKRTRNEEWFRVLSSHRDKELKLMWQCFNSAFFHRERQKFVCKLTDKEYDELNMKPRLFREIQGSGKEAFVHS